MKIPSQIKKYCPKCKTHTLQKVSQAKKKKASSLVYGSKTRAKLRGQAKGKGNLGRYSKPAISKFKMTGKKATKKTDLRYECKVCKKQSVQNSGRRAKKVQII